MNHLSLLQVLLHGLSDNVIQDVWLLGKFCYIQFRRMMSDRKGFCQIIYSKYEIIYDSSSSFGQRFHKF